MTQTTATVVPTTAEALSDELVTAYRRDGFVRVPQVLTPEEVERYREAVIRFREHGTSRSKDKVFAQYVDVWQQDETLRELTLEPRMAAIAAKLAGVPVRIWHDHLLIKDPHNKVATEFHQDRPYWPHQASTNSLSAWIALVDVPYERGCMSFIPGSHSRTDLQPQDLHDAGSLFGLWPESAWMPRVTIPLRAGDCTFHSSFTAHTANSNHTDEARIAHVSIYMDAKTQFSGKSHPVTDSMDLTVGETFPDERFPLVG